MLLRNICVMVIGLFWAGMTQQGQAQSNPQNLDIFLVIGQSNMAGRAEITAELQHPIEGVYLYTGMEDSLWIPAKNPLNLYSSIRKEVEMQRIGPAYNFAKTLRSYNTAQEIGLVVNAKGGTALAEWMPGTHFYDEAVNRVKAAARQGTIRGVIWHQGESDLVKLETYLPNLEILITQLRADLGIPDLPFVAGHIATDQPERKVFNELIDQLPLQVPYTSVVDATDTKTFDDVHFDTKSQLLMGQRYGDKMLQLLEEVAPETAFKMGDRPLFSFGVISDVQYADVDQAGERNYRGTLAILEKTVEKLNRHDLVFTVNLGDLIDRDVESFAKPLSILEKSHEKVHHVFGNHDFTVADEHKQEVPELLGNPEGYYSFSHGAVVFVVLNGMDNSLDGHALGTKGYKKAAATLAKLEEAGASNAKPWNGGLGKKQIKWLSKTLTKANKQDKKVIIFCHYPLLPENGLQLWNNREVLTLLDKHSHVLAYFSGHHHAGNYVVENHVHHLTFYGMVEAKSPSLGAVVHVYGNRLELEGIGDQESRELLFK